MKDFHTELEKHLSAKSEMFPEVGAKSSPLPPIIAFEGIDACGKETQTKMLSEALHNSGYMVWSETFPRYHTPIGKLIRSWLTGKVAINDEALHMLYEADRYDFKFELEFFEDNHDVCDLIILDRFTLSNLAFAKAKGIDESWLLKLQSAIPKPDLTIILDIPVEESFSRRTTRDKHEKDTELLGKVRNEYKELAKNSSKLGQQIIILDGTKSPQAIHENIMTFIHKNSIIPTL